MFCSSRVREIETEEEEEKGGVFPLIQSREERTEHIVIRLEVKASFKLNTNRIPFRWIFNEIEIDERWFDDFPSHLVEIRADQRRSIIDQVHTISDADDDDE